MDIVDELRRPYQGVRGSRRGTREAAAIEIERLRKIERAARCFVQEAEDYPRYAPVKVWATPEADPYLKLRIALGNQQTVPSNEGKGT